MKKFLMIFALSSIAISSVNDFNNIKLNKSDEKNFEIVSSKLTYSIANKQKDINFLKSKLYKIDKKEADNFMKHIDVVEKIFVKIFKSDKNLVPKIIQYIYFEPVSTNDEKILYEETQKLLVAAHANANAKIFINNKDGNANFLLSQLEEIVDKKQINVYDNLSSKDVLKEIQKEILKDYLGRKKFKQIEVRVMTISGTLKTKQTLALAHGIFNKNFEGVEIEDFSFIEAPRKSLENTNIDTRLDTYKNLIDGIY